MAHDPASDPVAEHEPAGPAPAAAAVSGAPRLVVGLGNPGETYVDTRHNVGFRVLDELARRHGIAFDHEDCNARVARLESKRAGETDAERARDLLLVQPQTYMNRSGYSLRCLRERHGFEPADVLVVYDEVHLPLGRLRLRPKGSPAGHRGMESVIENLRTQDVARLRCGVGASEDETPPAPEELADFVLDRFRDDEREAVEEMIQRAADACETWFQAGTERAMNRHNG